MASVAPYRKTDDAVKALTPAQYRVTQQNGTERPVMGIYVDNNATCIYVDIVSGEPCLHPATNTNLAAAGYDNYLNQVEEL